VIKIQGKVYLVGAGPGDPELMTLKALRLIREADTILYDRLINPEILGHAKKSSKLIFVGKEPGRHIINQDAINSIIAKEASEKKVVVRLKGGDPFVLGRGGEEAKALCSMGIDFEVVPGVTSAISVPEIAGIPVTDRRASSSFTILTGHASKAKDASEVDFTKVNAETLVILMGLGNIENIVKQLKEKRGADIPVAVIQKGTTKNEKVVEGTLQNIISRVKEAKIRAPTIIVVGEVVKLRKDIMGE
jgi:uroporphyrin-III C-methyltransferase